MGSSRKLRQPSQECTIRRSQRPGGGRTAGSHLHSGSGRVPAFSSPDDGVSRVGNMARGCELLSAAAVNHPVLG